MKKVCRLSFTVMSFVLVLSLMLPLVASAEMVKKVDNFIVFLDQSGSMAQLGGQNGNQKLDQAIAAVTRMDKAIPELGYTSAVAMFAPYKTVSDSATYKTGSLTSAVNGVIPPFNNMTPMGDGLKSVDSNIGKLSGKTALILFTDGESNEGSDAATQAQALYGKNANLCIHVVSYADTAKGQATIDAIRALSSCNVVADGKSVSTDAGAAQFAKDVLYEEKQPAPAPAVVAPAPAPAPVPAPKPAPAPVAKEVITFNLLFGFDKSAITAEMVPVLEQAKMILEEDASADFVVSGHTDSTGDAAYNQGLSERRATSVKNWLVTNGVAASRLKTVGYGETAAKYDNGTKEGRKLNRRVELQTN